MGTVIDRVDLTHPGLLHRHSALHLAVAAARIACSERDAIPASWISWSTRGFIATGIWANPRWQR
ncbi:hypothetical protein NIIDMKKI_24380 [Mycobacterium kansasii]|uniref:Uncharacterized protein n=1 Tax=Mycobacterium kansasii TaxID=1768 RepID=A0A7G1IBJ1_MYCKA|nr:hypothetical protein NIIDMKKI_24380 [Mycobacterium kansasii]